MKPRFLALLLLGALLACKKKPPAPDEYDYHVFVEGTSALVKGVEMGGKPVEGGTEGPTGFSYTLKVPRAEHAADRAFFVLVATSCGTEKLPAKLAFGIAHATGVDAEDRERAEAKPGEQVLTDLQYEAPKEARVYLDGEGAGNAKVEVGTTALALDKSRHDVVVGSCATAREVKVDGKPVGTLTIEPRIVTGSSGKKVEVPGTTLVDPTGKHCYEVVTHLYTEKEVDTSNMARSAPKRLERAQVYQEAIDDFLKASPTEMKSEDGWPMRHELRRCATKGSKRK